MNYKISNNGLKNLTNLEILDASEDCGIDEHGSEILILPNTRMRAMYPIIQK